MAELAEALRDVVAANERFVLRRLVLQVGLIIGGCVGVAALESPWRWLALAVLVVLLLGAGQLIFFFAYWSRRPMDQPWRALALGAHRRREQVVELHAQSGEVLHLPVPLALLEQVLAAAAREQISVGRDEAARARLTAKSARASRLNDLEALLPHVAPDLRADVNEVLAQVRARDADASANGLHEALGALEVHLMAEHSAQTTTSLRGPNPVFAKEIRADLETITRLLGP